MTEKKSLKAFSFYFFSMIYLFNYLINSIYIWDFIQADPNEIRMDHTRIYIIVNRLSLKFSHQSTSRQIFFSS